MSKTNEPVPNNLNDQKKLFENFVYDEFDNIISKIKVNIAINIANPRVKTAQSSQIDVQKVEEFFAKKYLVEMTGKVSHKISSDYDDVEAPSLIEDLAQNYMDGGIEVQQAKVFARALKILCDGVIKEKAAQAGVVVPRIAK